MDEVVAIERLKRGDISGLETLVRRYQVRAVRAAYLVTRDRPLAEDIVQAAFLRAYERIGQFDAQRRFGPWFLRSVLNDAIKAAHRRERQVSLDHQTQADDRILAEVLADHTPGPEALWAQAELYQNVHEALGKLSPRLRATIVLRYFLDLSEADIGDQLGCPRGTVKRRLHDARERLRALLATHLAVGHAHEPTGEPLPAICSPRLTQKGESR